MVSTKALRWESDLIISTNIQCSYSVLTVLAIINMYYMHVSVYMLDSRCKKEYCKGEGEISSLSW